MGKLVTNEEFRDRVYKEVGREYTPIESYKKANVNIKFKHNKCGTVFEMSPNHFLKDGRRCSYCYHGNAKSEDKFIDDFNKVSNGNYCCLDSYHRENSKIRVKHLKCGTVFETTPHMFLRGIGCPDCFGNKRKTTEQFKNEVIKLTNGEFECKSIYRNSKSKVTIFHNKCKKYYKVSPHDFLQGNRCPYCKQSKGEMTIASILDRHNISYEIQKIFKDCGNDRQRMPFDFYLNDYNLLIEYDGIQHYKEVKYFGGKAKLDNQKKRDKIKDDYANNNNINLLRVPYYLDNKNISKLILESINTCKAENP